MSAVELLKRSIMNSRNESLLGNHDAAVRCLLGPIEAALNSRTFFMIMQFHRQTPWPVNSVRLYKNELEIRLELLSESFDTLEADAIRAYASAFCELLAPTLVESFVVLLENLCRGLALSSIALSVQFTILKLIAPFRWCALVCIKSVRQDLHKRSLGLGYFLQEPLSQATKLLREHELYMLRSHSLRKFHQRQGNSRSDYLRAFLWEDLVSYRRFVQKSTQSRVLVTIHMGDFLGAFSRISQESSEQWTVLALRREKDEAGDPLGRIDFGPNTTLLRPESYNPVQIAARLRLGRHTLAILCDLNRHFGETVQVDFLGHIANFVRGPASIAVLSATPIIPFSCFHENGSEHIAMNSPIDTHPIAGENFSQTVSRITQQLVCVTEGWVLRHPQQWKYLPEVTTFLSKETSLSIRAKQERVC